MLLLACAYVLAMWVVRCEGVADPRGWIYSLHHWPEPRLDHPPLALYKKTKPFSTSMDHPSHD